ncbi:MAG: hypothetical protein EPN93_08220 [Spirochaetes bacterium]|nr:MAG: hypothetical protein EPN93_08220 [Spirochaetota bacterium]
MSALQFIAVFSLGFLAVETLAAAVFLNTSQSRGYLPACAAVAAGLVLTAFPLPFEAWTAAASIALFPAAYALVTRAFIRATRALSPVPVLAGSVCVAAAAVIFPSAASVIVAAWLGFAVLVHMYFFFTSVFQSQRAYVALQVALALSAGLFAWAGFERSLPLCALAASAQFHLTSIVIAFGFHRTAGMAARNLDESRRLNRQLVHTINRLRQKSEQLNRIIQEKEIELMQMSRHASLAEITTGIAHELMQPFTGIKGIAQNMMDDITGEEFEGLQAVADLTKICALVDKSASIIDHIRNFSRKSGLNKQFIDVNKVIMDALDLVSLQFKKFSIDIVLMLSETPSRIYGDKISLEQLIINLLLNARDAIIERRRSESGDYAAQISIASVFNGEVATLSIEDNGIGITQENIKKIWSPFFTTKRKSTGTGVGLSISSRILKEHNAEVQVASLPGLGTRFTIQFPLRREKGVIAVS